MKQYIFMFLVIFLCNCNQTKRQTVNEPTVNVDTLFEKEIPVLTFNNKALQRELDSIVEKEINCYYYKKDTTCFGMWAEVIEKDTLLGISSGDCYNFDFNKSFDEIRKIDAVYGCFKYKDFSFFCYTSSIKYTDLFYETADFIKVKNSPLLYVEYESEVDDSRTQWVYFYKNRELIEFSIATCE